MNKLIVLYSFVLGAVVTTLCLSPCASAKDSTYTMLGKGYVTYKELGTGDWPNWINMFPEVDKLMDSVNRKTDYNKNIYIVTTFGERPNGTGENNFVSHILHKEDGDTTQYIYENKNIYLVFIGLFVQHLNFDIQIQNQENSFISSLKDLGSLIQEMNLSKPGVRTGVDTTFYAIVMLNPDQITTPATVKIKVWTSGNKSAEFDYKIHEKNHWLFRVGVSSSYLDRNQFEIQNNNIIVKPDSIAQKQWKSNVIVMVQWHPFGRDIDNFAPSIFSPFDQFAGRWSINAGLELSTNPLEALFCAASYAISKDIDIDVGATWQDDFTPTVKYIGNITSLADAENFLKRSYSKPQLFLGVSFAPSAFATFMGLNK